MQDKVYQLSLFIHSVDVDKSIIPSNNQTSGDTNQIWCVLSIDGSDILVSTSSVPISSHSEFNYELSINFQPPSIRTCHLFLNLCSFDENDKSNLIALARAKVSIDKLPLNGPNAFRIPLMSKTSGKKNKKKSNSNKRNTKYDEFHQVATILISGIIDPPLLSS